MKKTTTITLLFAAITIYALYVGCGQSGPDASKAPNANLMVVPSQSRLPQDVLQSCTISQSEFNSWFISGTAAENGIVGPANSVTFGHNNNCDFYKWSWQMFAWMTSPIGGNKTVMESQVFYTVSPADGSGNRTLIPHTPGQPLQVTSSITQFGPNQLPTILDKNGKLFEVEKQPVNVKPMLMTGTKVHKVEIDAAGKPVFKDQAGKTIQNPKARLATKSNNKNIVQEFKATNGKSVFLTADGTVIESEEGQAGGGHGLMAQNGSLVYYITLVNDVFAYYLSGVKDKLLPDSQKFPTTAAERDLICAVARSQGVTLSDSNALAMEFKTSWVEASSLPDPQNYITIDAVIPTYNKTDTLWTPTNTPKTVKLAMLGMHVVGSAAGHPEMIWATFEHQKNSPNASYVYLNTQKVVNTVPQDSQGKWTLSSNPLDPAPDVAHFKANGNTLIAESGFTISPSNTLMKFPWGTNPNASPNAEDGSSAASNSEVISNNNSVLGWLVGNDTRKNYLLIGATWTSGGAPPSGTSFSTNPTDPGAAIGTSLLANSTMETYKQSSSNSCFSCHSASGSGGSTPNLSPDTLSHVYTGILPLFKAAAPKK